MKFKTLALFALGATMLLAQNSETDHPFQFGLKVGIPVTDMFSASNTSMFNDALNVPGSI